MRKSADIRLVVGECFHRSKSSIAIQTIFEFWHRSRLAPVSICQNVYVLVSVIFIRTASRSVNARFVPSQRYLPLSRNAPKCPSEEVAL